ncbi:hypothetical protein BKI52_03440 [marine bacterium AO1-C]|nr:hypothetical protein BKI52_03440 [marine bacterium AO1-C]
MTTKEKILSLLKSENKANVELGFQLCLSFMPDYDEDVRERLQRHPFFCARYGFEKTFLQDLAVLNLTYRNLDALPQEAFSCPNLHALLLYNNNFTELPQEISWFSKLDILILEENQLTDLPESLASLEYLTTLFIGMNNLKTIPAVIYNLKNLKILDLGGNPLSLEEKWRIRHKLPNCDISF